MNESELRKRLLDIAYDAAKELSFDAIYGVFRGVSHVIEVQSTFEIAKHIKNAADDPDHRETINE